MKNIPKHDNNNNINNNQPVQRKVIETPKEPPSYKSNNSHVEPQVRGGFQSAYNPEVPSAISASLTEGSPETT